MKQLLKILTQKTIKNFLLYALGLILNKEKQSCTKMSKRLGISHDRLYNILSKSKILLPLFPKLMISIAKHFSKKVARSELD